MMKYTKLENEDGNSTIQRENADGTITSIPMTEDNSDYQRYLRWLENPDAEEGGTL